MSEVERLRARYLEIVKRSLADFLYDFNRKDDEDPGPFTCLDPRSGRTLHLTAYDIEKIKGLGGRDWAHSMSGLQGLNQLQQALETVLKTGIPGDLIETGVLRGGTCLFMRAILKAYGVTDRQVWLADSFQGFPPEVPKPWDVTREPDYVWFASPDEVADLFRRYGLLDDQVRFLPGWFADTLPTAPIRQLAILRLDGDLYSSTHQALDALYPKLSPGGYAIVDDYHAFAECSQAVEEYRSRHGIMAPCLPVGSIGVYWRKDLAAGHATDPESESEPESARLPEPPAPELLRQLYLDMVKRSVGDFLYDQDRRRSEPGETQWLPDPLTGELRPMSPYDLRKIEGQIASATAQTLIGLKRMNQLQQAIETLIQEGVPGDLLEAGVLRGGVSVLMRAVLEAYGVHDRCVWLADSFLGPPAEDGLGKGPEPDASQLQARQRALFKIEQRFYRYDLLDDQVRFLPGWFADTLPTAPLTRLALIFLDADLTGSTLQVLQALYPRLSPGGYVMVDDYYRLASCRHAVDAYRQQHRIETPLIRIEHGAYWRKRV